MCIRDRTYFLSENDTHQSLHPLHIRQDGLHPDLLPEQDLRFSPLQVQVPVQMLLLPLDLDSLQSGTLHLEAPALELHKHE